MVPVDVPVLVEAEEQDAEHLENKHRGLDLLEVEVVEGRQRDQKGVGAVDALGVSYAVLVEHAARSLVRRHPLADRIRPRGLGASDSARVHT